MAVALWSSRTPGAAQLDRDRQMMNNKKKVEHPLPTNQTSLTSRMLNDLLSRWSRCWWWWSPSSPSPGFPFNFTTSSTRSLKRSTGIFHVIVRYKDKKTERHKVKNTERQKKILHICSYKYINIFWFCMHWLAMSNSCYNPFIYLLLNVSIINHHENILIKLNYTYHYSTKTISFPISYSPTQCKYHQHQNRLQLWS